MRTRLSALVAVAGIAVAVIPAHAAGPAAAPAPKPQITDVPGDANGINNQGIGLGPDASVAGPADDSNADITSVLFQTKFKTVTTTKTVVTIVKKKKVVKKTTVTTRVPDGFTVTMSLSAAPDGNHAYDVLATHAICNGTIDFTYSTGPIGLNQVGCLPSDPTSTDFPVYAGEAAVVGNSVVWTVPQGAFANGSSFTDLAAATAISPTLDPVMDDANGGSASYKVGA